MKQIKYLILGIMLLALIGSINAYSTNQFYDGLRNENLTFPNSLTYANETSFSGGTSNNLPPFEYCTKMNIYHSGRLNVTSLGLGSWGYPFDKNATFRIRDTNRVLLEEFYNGSSTGNGISNRYYPNDTYYICIANTFSGQGHVSAIGFSQGTAYEFITITGSTIGNIPAFRVEVMNDNFVKFLQIPTGTILTNAFINLSGYDNINNVLSNDEFNDGSLNISQWKNYSKDTGGLLFADVVETSFLNMSISTVGGATRLYLMNYKDFSDVSKNKEYIIRFNWSDRIQVGGTNENNRIIFTNYTNDTWGDNNCLDGSFGPDVAQLYSTGNPGTTYDITRNNWSIIINSSNWANIYNYTGTKLGSTNLNSLGGSHYLNFLVCSMSGNGGLRLYNFSITELNNFTGQNKTLYIGNNKVWNYEGQFNQSNNKTNNLANIINSYLTTCTFSNGFCLVPFIFHSDTSGILSYSDLIFNNNGILENNVSYTSSTLEGQTNAIIGNFTLSPPDSIVLNYNGLNYTPNVNLIGYTYILTNNLTSPLVTSNQNISFYYIFTINGITYNSNIYNQTITNIQLSTNCAGNFNFINFVNYDEETLNQINGTIEYVLTLLSNNNELSSINGSVYGSNFTLCSNENLTNSYTNYNLQLRYYDTNYLYKTYNIQNNQITNIPINLNLYYLNNSIGTQFKINYVDFNYLTYPGAIIQIQRQYLSSNSYNVVEIPKMDNKGQAIGSFNTKNIRYKLIVINNGVILDTFNDIFPVCQNIVLGQCELDLRGSQNNPSSTTGDFTYTLIKTNNSIILTYIIPSGTPRNIQFISNQNSRFLNNITNCDNSIFASGGTISCYYNQTIGDSIISTKIVNSDGTTLYGSIQISEDLSSFFMLNNYFIAFVLLLSLALMLTSSAVMMVIGSVAGLLYLGLIYLLRGADLVTVVGSLMWLIVASVIILYYISKKEERT